MTEIAVTLLPGDGIGPEIAESVRALFSAAKVPIRWEQIEIGIDAYQRTGTLISQEVFQSLERTRCALKGPTTTPTGGGHRSINVTLRQELDLFANVRPVRNIQGIETPFKQVDILFVRENTEDLYKGVEYRVSPDVAHGIKIITRAASERVGRHAFLLARKLGRKKVTIVHKANIMKICDGLFLEAIRAVSTEFPDISLDDVIVDACCMQLVRKPQNFDVIVTENLYGDILTDLGSGLIGGLGVAAGANFGKDMAIFEAVHGSAPDIAGQGLANPTALISSALMMLEHLELRKHYTLVSDALNKTLADPGTRTKDLGGSLSTQSFTNAIIDNLGASV